MEGRDSLNKILVLLQPSSWPIRNRDWRPVRHETPLPQSAIGDIGLKEGNVIEHQRFGVGTVVKVEGSGENAKATVTFKNAGTKQLLLKFARYTIIG